MVKPKIGARSVIAEMTMQSINQAYVYTGEDLGYSSWRGPTEHDQGQKDPDGSLQEGGYHWMASNCWEPAA